MDSQARRLAMFRELVLAALTAPDPEEADRIVRRYLRGEIPLEEALRLVKRIAKVTLA